VGCTLFKRTTVVKHTIYFDVFRKGSLCLSPSRSLPPHNDSIHLLFSVWYVSNFADAFFFGISEKTKPQPCPTASKRV
jgi:hypothetical protein